MPHGHGLTSKGSSSVSNRIGEAIYLQDESESESDLAQHRETILQRKVLSLSRPGPAV